MRLIKQISLAALMALPVMLLVGVSTASASSFRSSENPSVPKDEVINDTLFIAGNSVIVSGIINGDVFCVGQNVNITGRVNGDVICAAQNIRISGNVKGDVRLAAQVINLAGKVESNATTASQALMLEEGGSVSGDFTLGAGTAQIMGNIGRDLVASTDSLVINSQIGRSVSTESESVRLNEKAKIAGALTYTSQNDADVQQGASVKGGLNKQDPPRDEERTGVLATAVGFGYTVLTLFIASMVLALLVPKQLHTVTNEGLLQPGRTILIGLIACIVVPTLAVVLAVSLIGLPLGLLLGLGWIIALLLSGTVFAYYLGRQIMRGSNNALIFMLVGSLAVLLLYGIPIINVLAVLLVIVFGSGMLVSSILGSIGKPSYKLRALESGKEKK